MQPGIITVSQFLAVINETLSVAFPEVLIEGEISGYKVNQGRFVFFDLKDGENSLSCFMMLYQLRLPLEDGMKVRVTGSVKVTKWSKFSLTARTVEPAGEGELKRAQELLRRKLAGEGLFDTGRKRPLPRFPASIGLVTSSTSAAYADFIKILNSRWGGVTVRLADVTVQGRTAPDQVAAAISYFSAGSEDVDVVVVIRGGGSLEDLAAFSTEPVVRSVAASRIPVVVGVGHEIDTSLADLAADVRAATPTDAARLVVPDRSEVKAAIDHAYNRLESGLSRAIDTYYLRLDRGITRLHRFLARPLERLRSHEHVLWRGLEKLAARLHRDQTGIRQSVSQIDTAFRVELQSSLGRLELMRRVIRSAGPEATLRRGYAIVSLDGKVVTDRAGAPTGESVMIKLRKGMIMAEVRSHGDES